MKIAFVYIFLATAFFASGRKLPPFITPCRLNDPQVDECIRSVFDSIRHRLIQGIPEMQIPPIDPFYVPEVTLDSGRGTATGLKAVFRDVLVEGGKDVTINRFHIDINAPSFEADVHFPIMAITSNYTLNGNILILQLNGHGKGHGNFTDVDANVKFTGSFRTKKNKRYVYWTDKTSHITVKGGAFNFQNLIDGNQALTESTNQVLNENFGSIIEEFIPLVEETVSSIVFDVLKRVFHLYAIEELFNTE